MTEESTIRWALGALGTVFVVFAAVYQNLPALVYLAVVAWRRHCMSLGFMFLRWAGCTFEERIAEPNVSDLEATKCGSD